MDSTNWFRISHFLLRIPQACLYLERLRSFEWKLNQLYIYPPAKFDPLLFKKGLRARVIAKKPKISDINRKKKNAKNGSKIFEKNHKIFGKMCFFSDKTIVELYSSAKILRETTPKYALSSQLCYFNGKIWRKKGDVLGLHKIFWRKRFCSHRRKH